MENIGHLGWPCIELASVLNDVPSFFESSDHRAYGLKGEVEKSRDLGWLSMDLVVVVNASIPVTDNGPLILLG